MYHANYLHFAERARMEFLRAIGFDVVTIAKTNGLIFAVRRCEIDFIAPALLDDVIAVESEIVHLGGASMQFRQVINKISDNSPQRLAEMIITLVAVNAGGKPGRIPDDLRAALETLLAHEMAHKGE